jgi:hypothetical protein
VVVVVVVLVVTAAAVVVVAAAVHIMTWYFILVSFIFIGMLSFPLNKCKFN